MTGLLLGRLAIVTGGGSGIGRAVCQLFSREGASVIVADINGSAAKSTCDSLTGDNHFGTLDVKSHADVNSFLKESARKFSKAPDIVVNAAGITRDAFMKEMTEEMWDDVIDVNLKGTFLVTQAAANYMVQSKVPKGSIINISSVNGKVGNMGQTNYAASKAGVIGLTKSVAKEFSKFNIRCNAIMPGFIKTPMVQTMPEKLLDLIIMQIPLGRAGKPEEVADACLFLASDKSSYITGSTLQISGGLYM